MSDAASKRLTGGAIMKQGVTVTAAWHTLELGDIHHYQTA